MQINKIQQPPIFARKLQILIKSFFPNKIFCFLLLCVQEVVQYGTIPVPGQGHFFIVTSGLPGPCRIALFSLVCNFVEPYLANYLANLLQLWHIFSPKAPLKGPKVGKRWVLWSQRYLPLSPKLASQKNDKIFNGLYFSPI